jgi:hypothetical protein
MKARPIARASIPDGFRGLGHTGALRDGLSLDDVDGDANGALATATQITLEKAPVAVPFQSARDGRPASARQSHGQPHTLGPQPRLRSYEKCNHSRQAA